MPSIDYQIARAFTAQSKWSDPKQIRGGRPELTPDDIRAAVSMATSPLTFHALMAKYAQSDISENWLFQMLEKYSWVEYGKRYPNRQVTHAENTRLVEAAMLYYLIPERRRNLSDAQHADWMRCHRNTWSAKWKAHFHEITKLLFELEESAKREVHRMNRRYASPGVAL